MNTDKLIELRADGPIAVFTFAVGEPSKLSRKFASALAAILAAAPKGPLILNSDGQLLAVFRAAPETTVNLFSPGQHGTPLFDGRVLRMADAKPVQQSNIEINTTTGIVEVPERGTWAGGKTPETVARWQLPVLDCDAMSRALVDLVERWAAAGDIVDAPTWRDEAIRDQRARNKLPTLAERAQAYIKVDLRDLDPTDPIRQDRELIAKIRELQAERVPDKPERGFMRSIVGRVRG